ncbi:MAG: acyltransferase [Undibacterium sp.]|nr:acyltransferase [Undibacterium sp.]
MMKSAVNYRVPALDWLRVGLIIAVFAHHVCMPFNGDPFVVMNADHSKFLDDTMVFFEQFRLPLLFLISGIGSVLMLEKLSAKDFLKQRAWRLIVPLILAMLVITPPQYYIEHLSDYRAHFTSFWQAFPAISLKMETYHLWFIKFLVVFAVLLVPFVGLLNTAVGQQFEALVARIARYRFGVFGFVIVLILLKLCLRSVFPSEDKKIVNLSVSLFYFFFFAAGIISIRSVAMWEAIVKFRFSNLLLAMFSGMLFYAYYYLPDSVGKQLSSQATWSIWYGLCCLVAWSVSLTLLGYARTYFVSSPQWLKNCNELIYPFYIFHQTVIVVVAYFVVQMDVGIVVKLVLLFPVSLLLTASLCWFVVRPFNWLRWCFGLKPRKIHTDTHSPSSHSAYPAAR